MYNYGYIRKVIDRVCLFCCCCGTSQRWTLCVESTFTLVYNLSENKKNVFLIYVYQWTDYRNVPCALRLTHLFIKL